MICAHQNVTILFTDIVGFTEMAQTCEPYEVMSFLHNMFTDFDDLIEMNSHLWKVETIGDAFMVASGLGMTSGESFAFDEGSEGKESTSIMIEFQVPSKHNASSGDSSLRKASVSVRNFIGDSDAANAAIAFGKVRPCLPLSRLPSFSFID